MRVLQIINSLATGGAEKLLLDTIPLYRKRGIEMDILLLWDNNHDFTQKLKNLNCCNIFILNQSHKTKKVYSLWNILKIMPYLKKYDVAHVHLFPAQYYVVFANLLTGKKCKLIFTEHSTFNRRINNRLFHPLERFVYGKYEEIICITVEIQHKYKDYLRELKNKFIVIRNGVNLSIIENASVLKYSMIHPSLKEEDRIIIQVSAFRKEKDQRTAIRSINRIKDQTVKLLLVGSGAYKQGCENLVKELSLEGRVIFLGQRMDVPQLLKSSEIILLSSKYEGLSLSSIEGMASGRPFVASNVPGLKDIVSGAGLLFEYGNEVDLAEKIKSLLSNRKLYNEVADACQEKAKQFDIISMVEKHINLYKSL